MTPLERSQLQKRILESARAAVPGGRPTNIEVANAAGCDRTEIPRFEHGERKMDLDEIIALADRFGGEAVLAPIAELFGLHVVPAEAVGDANGRELSRNAALLTQGSAMFSVAVQEAISDGRLTDDEAEELERRQLALIADARRLCLRRVRAGRVA